jgi:hypothetical protein
VEPGRHVRVAVCEGLVVAPRRPGPHPSSSCRSAGATKRGRSRAPPRRADEDVLGRRALLLQRVRAESRSSSMSSPTSGAISSRQTTRRSRGRSRSNG